MQSEKMHGTRVLDLLTVIERLGLEAKMKFLLCLYQQLLDKAMWLSASHNTSEGVSDEIWFNKHAKLIGMFSDPSDWQRVLAHSGTFTPSTAISLLNLCKLHSGNALFGEYKYKAVTDYLDQFSQGHLTALESECVIVRQKDLDAKWDIVLKEATDRNILSVFEEQRNIILFAFTTWGGNGTSIVTASRV